MSNFSVDSTSGVPAFNIAQAIVSNTGGTGGLNSTNALALRTVKNFVINGAFTYIPIVDTDSSTFDLDRAQNNTGTFLTDAGLLHAQLNCAVTWALIYVP